MFTPDNKYIITGASDYIRVFDVQLNKLVFVLSGGHKKTITGLAVSSDSRFLVSGGLDGTLVKWDLQRREILQIVEEAHHGTTMNGKSLINFANCAL